MSEALDILSVVKGGVRHDGEFRVSFDFYTPRAHFIILARRPGIWKDIMDMDPNHQHQVIQVAKDAANTLSLSTAILSFHRGSWVTSKDVFHCHICTDAAPYLDVFERVRKQPPMTSWDRGQWQSLVTKQWKASRDPNSYAENVKYYYVMPNKYKQWEINDINKWRSKNGAGGNGMTAHEGMRLVYHQYKRQIGLVGPAPTDTESIRKLVLQLDRLAVALGVDRQSRDGCHVCVDLNGKGFGGFHSDRKVYGYLLVPGPMMYANCPREHREVWFRNFQRPEHDDRVYT